jgi:hypothetical protein
VFSFVFLSIKLRSQGVLRCHSLSECQLSQTTSVHFGYNSGVPRTEKDRKLGYSARLLVLAATLSFGLFMPCHAQGVKTSRTFKSASVKDIQVVQVNLGNEADGSGDEPLKALSAALAQNSRSRFFRVTWDCIVGSLSATVTALYDRRRKTISYYCWGGHNMGGNPAEIDYAHYLYTGVTDNRICQASLFLRIQAPYPNAVRSAPTYFNSGTAGSYYDALLTFGCHRRKLP